MDRSLIRLRSDLRTADSDDKREGREMGEEDDEAKASAETESIASRSAASITSARSRLTSSNGFLKHSPGVLSQHKIIAQIILPTLPQQMHTES